MDGGPGGGPVGAKRLWDEAREEERDSGEQGVEPLL